MQTSYVWENEQFTTEKPYSFINFLDINHEKPLECTLLEYTHFIIVGKYTVHSTIPKQKNKKKTWDQKFVSTSSLQAPPAILLSSIKHNPLVPCLGKNAATCPLDQHLKFFRIHFHVFFSYFTWLVPTRSPYSYQEENKLRFSVVGNKGLDRRP